MAIQLDIDDVCHAVREQLSFNLSSNHATLEISNYAQSVAAIKSTCLFGVFTFASL